MKKKKQIEGEQLAPRHASAWQIFCRNKLAVVGLCFILFWVVMALLAPVIAPFEPNALDYSVSQVAPGVEGHLLGTDQYGRDILTRVLYGARISMWCGVISVGISLIIGTVLGGIAGYYGGVVSIIIMRVMDAMCAFPSLVLAIVRWAVFNIPMICLLNYLVGMYGIIWSPIVGDTLTVLVSIYAYCTQKPVLESRT